MTTDVLVRICIGLHCELEDIMELVEDDVLNVVFYEEKIESGFRDVLCDMIHTKNRNEDSNC